MNGETLVVTGLAVLATLPLVVMATRRRAGTRRLAPYLVWAAAVAAFGFSVGGYQPTSVELATRDVRPLVDPIEGYVTSDQCRACHPQEYDSWRDSYHRSMTTLASPDTVLAPFDDLTVGGGGNTFRFWRTGDEYWVELPQPGWEGTGPAPPVQQQIVQVTGSHHAQVYWTATGKARRLSLLPIGYRIAEAQILSLDALFLTPPEVGQMTDMGRWNTSCNQCHATHPRPRTLDPAHMDTHVSELGIACEACHGPGDEHVTLNRDPRRRYGLYATEEADATIVNPERLDHRRASEVCGSCHGVGSHHDQDAWKQNGTPFRPGDVLEDTRSLVTEGDDRFWSDGMIRVSGREFAGLRRTPCFERGEMSCLSCHTLHQPVDDPRPREEWANDQLGLGMDGNAACMSCHADFYEGTAALTDHTHHAPDSTGSNCYNCHMPFTSYGLMKAIRSHELSSPDVATSVATGRPNGCNQCHLDKTLAWTAEHLTKWYDQPVPKLDERQRSIAASVQWAVAGDAGQRALMAWSFGWDAAREASGTEWMTPYLSVLMSDNYHTVRSIAYRSLLEQPQYAHRPFEFVPPGDVRYRAVMEDWNRSASSRSGAARPELLIKSDGLLDAARLEQLLSTRDNRPITLQE